MASLILGGVLLVTDKIQASKAKKKEKKQKAYENRYNDLQKEQKDYEEKVALERKTTGDSSSANVESSQQQARRNSSDSQKSLDDNPARWVSEAMTARRSTDPRQT